MAGEGEPGDADGRSSARPSRGWSDAWSVVPKTRRCGVRRLEWAMASDRVSEAVEACAALAG